MKKLVILFLAVLPFLGVAQNPFEFIGKTKFDIEKIIGKPVAKDYSKIVDGQLAEQFAYPFTAYGGYHIGYVNDTARAFMHKPKDAPVFSQSAFNFSQFFPSIEFKESRQNQYDVSRKSYYTVVKQNGQERTVIVECFRETSKVAKVTFL